MEYSTIQKVLQNLYTNKKSTWIGELEDSDIEPFIIQTWLGMNDDIRLFVRWLDKYVFYLPPKMYLSLAWSIIPKFTRVPFVNYVKKKDEVEEFSFILSKVKKHLELSDNDFNSCKYRLIEQIKSDMPLWFAYYGIEKKYWKKYYLDFDKIKGTGGDVKGQLSGLDKWGF